MERPGLTSRALFFFPRGAALAALLLLTASVALADLSLVQIVQSQTSAGENGLFGKTWVQVSGRKMRLVSGHARKFKSGRKGKQGPVRLIQIIDLDKGSALLLDPTAKTFESGPLTDVRYAGSVGRSSEPASAHLRSSQIEVERGRLDRDVGDLRWWHYRVGVKVRLDEGEGVERLARMEQDLWIAPLTGDLQEGLLDLAAFETDYRKATGSRFSPLDYWTYQMREVASYLRVPEEEVQDLLTQVRDAFPAVPGYPLASSISWWKDTEPLPPETAPEAPVAKLGDGKHPPWPSQPPPHPSRLRPIPSFYPVRSRFRPIDFSGSWRVIDRMTGSEGGERKKRYPEYAVFQEEMRKKVAGAMVGTAAKTAEAARGRARAPAKPSPSRTGLPEIPVPFYQINTELDAFSSVDEIPAEDFVPPPDYKLAPATKGR
ncbi:MAG: hypothetical protein HZB91_02470 [Elusimicrobia bacterium]|nr:hypothetical protein [Elusimicrobiota bacterium]